MISKYKHPSNKKGPTCLGDCLIVGAGPVGITIASLLDSKICSGVSIFTPVFESETSPETEFDLKKGKVRSTGQINRFQTINTLIVGEEYLKKIHPPDTIFLAVPNQYYREYIFKLHKYKLIKNDQTIFCLSTRIGSAYEIKMALNKKGINQSLPPLASFSTYFAASKFQQGSRTIVHTRAVKKKVYLGTTENLSSYVLKGIKHVFKKVGTEISFLDKPILAEIHNANAFIHAQIALQPDAIYDILDPNSSREYLYRPAPEGCLTQLAAKQIVMCEFEINNILKSLNLSEINLMEMLQKELYPIPELDENKLLEYPNQTFEIKTKQIYRWFIRRQNDPFTGLPHLNAVKLQKSYISKGKYFIPRIPAEDYHCIVLLTEIAKLLRVDCNSLLGLQTVMENNIAGLKMPANLNINHIHGYMKSLANTIFNDLLPNQVK